MGIETVFVSVPRGVKGLFTTIEESRTLTGTPRFGVGVDHRSRRGTETLDQRVTEIERLGAHDDAHPTLTDDTRYRLGTALRSIYEETCDTQPIPDSQVDLLLRLRHKERDRRRMD